MSKNKNDTMLIEEIKDIIDALIAICEKKNLRITLAGSLTCGMITGVAAFVSGLFFGPVGIAIGGVAGSVAAGTAFYNRFEPVAIVLKKMSDKDREELAAKVKKAVQHLQVRTVSAIEKTKIDALEMFLAEKSHCY